ncbi:MAG TPA: hypothetical protein VFR23_23465 [Jiangellaceae bacterium]|nr:hypothetical protein [Jiangellaceae bacterium]
MAIIRTLKSRIRALAISMSDGGIAPAFFSIACSSTMRFSDRGREEREAGIDA